ncbi:hypothetical protein SLA2020_286190 [Shorea laevis]
MVLLDGHQQLTIPRSNYRQFQLHAAIIMDHIWFVRNQLVHNLVYLVLSKSLQQIALKLKAYKLTWNDSKATTLWNLPPPGTVKANFDVAVKSDFSVAAMVLSGSNGNILHDATNRLSSTDVAVGEAQVALLATQSATSLGIHSFLLEGDAINIILVIQQQDLFKD